MLITLLIFIPVIIAYFISHRNLFKKRQWGAVALLTTTIILVIVHFCTFSAYWLSVKEMDSSLWSIENFLACFIVPLCYMYVCISCGVKVNTQSTLGVFSVIIFIVFRHGHLFLDNTPMIIDGHTTRDGNFDIIIFLHGKRVMGFMAYQVVMIQQCLWVAVRTWKLRQRLKDMELHMTVSGNRFIIGLMGSIVLVFIALGLPRSVVETPWCNYLVCAAFSACTTYLLLTHEHGFRRSMVVDVNEEPVLIEVAPKFGPMAKEFIRLMDEEKIYLQQNLKLEETAKMLGTNRTYFSQMMREELHTTFANFLNERRVEEAKRLLEEHPNFKLEEIAHLSGFSTSPTFTKVFKQMTGETPSNWTK